MRLESPARNTMTRSSEIPNQDDVLGDQIMMIHGEAQNRYMDVEFPGKKEVNQQQSMHTDRQFLTTKLTWLILSGAKADLNSRVLS